MNDFQALQAKLDRTGHRGKVTVGIVPSLRAVFETADGIAMTRELEATLARDPRVNLVTLNGLYADGVIHPEDNPVPTWKRMIEKEVDVLLLVGANYGDEVSAAAIARKVHGALECPVYTYDPFDGDPRANGTRPTDRTCGMWPMRQHLRHVGISASYIPISNIGDEVFNDGLNRMLSVGNIVRELTHMKMLQVGGNTPTFPGIATNDLDLVRYWGIEVINQELLTLVDRIRARLADPPEWLEETVASLFAGINTTEAEACNPKVLQTQVLLTYGLMEMLQENGCNAMTVRCWPELLETLQTMACYPLGLINDMGIPTSCETDRFGTVSLGILGAASIGLHTPVFADFTIVREGGDVLAWHCGPFAPSTCRSGCQPCLREGWILPQRGAGYLHSSNMELGDTVTMARLSTGMGGDMILMTNEAEVVDGPETRGTHFYYKVKDWAKYEAELMANPVVHHWAIVKGAHMDSVYEAAKWLYLPRVVLNDSEEAVKARLRSAGFRD